MKEFVREKTIYSDVKILIPAIDRLEQQFYMNRAQSYTIDDVKEKLKIIQE